MEAWEESRQVFKGERGYNSYLSEGVLNMNGRERDGRDSAVDINVLRLLKAVDSRVM